MSHCNLFWSKDNKVRLQMTHIVANSELLVMIPGIHYIFLSKMLLKVIEICFLFYMPENIKYFCFTTVFGLQIGYFLMV